MPQAQARANAAQGGRERPGWSDGRIAEALAVGLATVERLRQRFVEEGLEAALRPCRTGTHQHPTKLDGAQETHLIALAYGMPPEGRGRWTLRLLARRMVVLGGYGRYAAKSVPP